MQLEKFPTRADLCKKPDLPENPWSVLLVQKTSPAYNHALVNKGATPSSDHTILNKPNSIIIFFSMHAEKHPGREKTAIYIFPSNCTWRSHSKFYKTRIYMRTHGLFAQGYLHCGSQRVFCFPPPVPRTLLLAFRCRFTGKWKYRARSCRWKTRIW